MQTVNEEFVLALGAGTPAEQQEVLAPLLEKHGPALYSFIVALLKTRTGSLMAKQMADDIFQDLWFNVRDAAERGRFEGRSPESRLKYIFGIAANTVREKIRSVSRQPQTKSFEQEMASATEVAGHLKLDLLKPELWDCIQQLPQHQRQVFEFMYVSYLHPPSSKDVGSALGLADVTVRGYQRDGRQLLKDCMRRKGFGNEINDGGGSR